LPKSFAIKKYIDHLKKDKVNNGRGVRLVLLKKLGEYSLIGNIDETLIENIIKKHLIAS
jgi:3-dehydroquinate synthetase